MRKSLAIVIFLLVVGNARALRDNSIAGDGDVTISCKITNPKEGPFFIIKKNALTGEEKTVSSIEIDERKELNTFRFESDSFQLVYLNYQDISVPIFVAQGQNVTLSFDANDINNTIAFTGPESNINNYLVAKHKKLRRSFVSDLRMGYSSSLTDFSKKNDSVYHEFKNLLKMFIPTKNEVNKAFIYYEECDLFARWAILRMNFPDYHFHFTKEKIILTSDYYHFLNSLPVETSYGLLSENYVNLLSMIIDFEIRRTFKETGLSIKEEQLLYLNKKYDLAKTFVANEVVNEFVTTQRLLSYFNLGFEDSFAEKLQNAKTVFTKNRFLQFAIDQFELRRKIGKGNVAPDFDFTDIQGKKVSLSAYKGQNVFINVWSPGCHGSLEELPSLTEIQKQFKVEDKIIFLNIYNESDIENLKEFIGTNYLAGIHGLAGGWESSFNKLYFINSTPRYILINKEGKVIDPFAPRPSSPELLPLLKSLTTNK